MLPDEDEALRALYLEYNIPSDQYIQRPDDLKLLVDSWNCLTSREETPTDILHYILNRRKQGKWEKLGRAAGKDFVRPRLAFTDEELAVLDEIHEELQIASDRFALDSELAQTLQQEFAKRTSRIVPAMILAAEMINRRKSGALATLKPKSGDEDLGFSDISQVGS
tara:strand:+ start:2053 stop:2550 length:498 start_codon:yes stop_codon:yes gene_type:complete